MKKTLCECSLQKRTKMISIFYLLVNLATGFYRSYQLGLIEFVGIGVLYLIHFSIVASFLTARFLCVLLGEYDAVKAFSCISNTLVAFILAMFSALLLYAVYNNHRQLMMPWLFTTILMACTRDVYMLIRSFFYASAGTWLGVLYVTAMVMQITLGMYLWWVVYGFYHELQDEENEKRKKDLLVGNSSTNPATSDPV